MALNGSGPISLAGATAGESIAIELGESATATIALNDTIVRDLAGVSSGAITMPTDFWGKASSVEGALYAWGRAAEGMLDSNISGRFGADNRSSPAQIGALTTWASIAETSELHTHAIKSNGTLWSWGANGVGQLGINITGPRSSPIQVGSLTTWAQVSTGLSHSVAVKTDGTLWGWGRNTKGQLGNNTSVTPGDYSSPIQVGSLTTWAQASAGYEFTAAITTSGALYVWGLNSTGGLGQNDSISRSSPVQVGALTNWVSVRAMLNENTTIALKTDGTLWAWGYGGRGNLGNNNTISRSSPVQIGALTTWAQISAGRLWGMAITNTDSLYVWGYNGSGVLGINNQIDKSSPVQVGGSWSKVAGGYTNSLGIKTNGSLWAWGNNDYGSLGQNDRVYKSSPVQIGALTTWGAIGGGGASFGILQ